MPVSRIGFHNDGEVDTEGGEVLRNIPGSGRDASGPVAAQPGGVLDVDRTADAGAEGVDGLARGVGDLDHPLHGPPHPPAEPRRPGHSDFHERWILQYHGEAP